MTRKRTTENDLVVSGGAAARRKASRLRTAHASAAEPASAAVPETVTTTPSEPTSSVTTVESPVVPAGAAHEEIARLAYSFWEARGYQGGSSEEDWLRAEDEVRRVAVAIL